ncbi:SpoIIE family protein phosphatase [Xanthocytophaga agilis]|uniref:SpoIIE family protein phosphatase n=1 Tax=Xanthocytophaga agilis TaxID=3048010 RepID=A0AAE3UI15_9BACT|nr:SpoIIE family protein phosphatase [Xanthocytophaga agilis]MDJ1503148.1 SpoIIE family protein phosphatase [Xanthocytophaga agilis]
MSRITYILRVSLLLFVLLGGSFVANAQQGNPYITNYTIIPANLPGYDLPRTFTSILSGGDQHIYVTNTKGVLFYNGSEWILVRTATTPLSLTTHPDYSERVYVGCQEGFGYVQTNANGENQFVGYGKEQKITGAITQIKSNGNHVYLLNKSAVYEWDVKEDQLSNVWKASGSATFQDLFVQKNQVFVNVAGKGLQRINGKQLTTVAGTEVLGQSRIVATIPLSEQKQILGTSNNRLWIFNGQQLSPLSIEAQSYLDANQLSSGTDLSASMYALATVSGGCVIIEKQTGKIRHVVNFQTGLPEDEIQAVSKDGQGNLWISHSMGVSRADFHFLVSNFSTYPGLIGNVTQVLSHKNMLYVATTEGIFYLDKSDSFQEVSGFIKQKRQIERITKTITIKENRKGLLGKLFGGKDDVKVDQKKEVIELEDKPTNVNRQQEIYALQSIPYLFKKVEGFAGKCRQLSLFEGRILAAGSNGVYQISGTSSTPLLTGVYVQSLYASTTKRILVGAQNGLYALNLRGDKWEPENYTRQVSTPVHSMCQEGNTVWLGSLNQVWKLELNTQGKIHKAHPYTTGLPYSDLIPVFLAEGKPSFIIDNKLYRFNSSENKLEIDGDWTKKGIDLRAPVYGQKDLTWMRLEGRWQEISSTQKIDQQRTSLLNLFSDLRDVYIDGKQNIWVVDAANQIYQINGDPNFSTLPALHVYLERVADKKGKNLPIDDVSVPYDQNALQFVVSPRQFGQEAAIQYQYRVSGIGNEWSEWQTAPVFRFPILPDGSFTLQVRARDAQGTISEVSEFDFVVRPPFWKTWWFQGFVLIAIAAGVVFFVRFRTYRLEQANRILEQRVEERTLEIRLQKEQIELQKNDIELQKHELELAYTDISKKNKHITGSINYAQKIQHAILPLESQIEKALPESFVFFQPRDTVSGDFYWFSEKEEVVIIAAVDCTGHGVPGAFMSMIGNTLLNQIVNEKGITEPAKILNLLHKGVRKALKQEEDNSERQDGMDIALCTFNKRTLLLQYAGANNSLYIVENGELIETKANKFGIGGVQKEAERLFTNHTFTVSANTHCYLFTDGYEDQFGGPDNRKFMAKRFRQLLVDIHAKPATEQKQILTQTIHDWKGHESQMDDMLVIGFQLPVSPDFAIKATLMDSVTQ